MTNTTRGDTETAFFVSDDGCGIPKEKRDTVLEPGETESRTGTGLGLAIVDRVAEAHGWDLRIVESVDGGARFILNNVDISGL
jgi:signal transduction histidine kinase